MRSLLRRGFVAALVLWSALIGIPNDPLGILLWGWLATSRWDATTGSGATGGRSWSHSWSTGWPAGSPTTSPTSSALPVHFTEPIRFDRWLGGLFVAGGPTPTEQPPGRLVRRPLPQGRRPAWWDVVLNTVYASHFYVAIALGVVLWVRNKDAWRDWMRRYVTLLFVGLAGYLLFPTAPPWLASKDGLIGPVSRITSRGWSELGIHRTNMVMHGMGNQVAAMPSLHTGISALVAFYAVSRLRSPLKWLLLLYPVAMGVALCYFGEHYVADEIAGVLVAGLVMLGWARIDRRRAGRTDSSP